MAHRLDPPEDAEALPPDEVEFRLRGEFAYVEADANAGARVVADMIRQFERMSASREIVKEHRGLQFFAVRFVVADRPDFVDDYLCFTCMPGRGVLVGYHSRRHEQAAKPLLERCARALGYGVGLL